MEYALTFSEKDIQQGKEISSIHNRKIAAIKEIRAKMLIGLREAKDLVDSVWDSVEHPLNVEYDGLDRLDRKLVIKSVRIEKGFLSICRSDGEVRSVKISKKIVQELKDFGVPSI